MIRPALAAALLAAAPVVAAPVAASAEGMAAIPGATFEMGSESHYREEGPIRIVQVDPFRISRTEITNSQFAAFVADTGYVTTAERRHSAEDHPEWPAELLEPGSMVFAAPARLEDLSDATRWWRWTPGASWRAPLGPGSDIDGLDDHPVVQVSPEDAEAYARWAGGRLPTEAEWEWAAQGGAVGALWDEPFDPVSGWKANTWQGAFPSTDLESDGHHGAAPVASYPPNGFGLYDMLGNVWEHVSDWWVPGHPQKPEINPTGPPEALAAHFSAPEIGSRRVVKGGSWLCAPNYCRRYRPSARQPAERGLGSNHIGFRIVKDAHEG